MGVASGVLENGASAMRGGGRGRRWLLGRVVAATALVMAPVVVVVVYLWASYDDSDADPLTGEVRLLDGPYGLMSRSSSAVIDNGRVFVWGGQGSVTGEDGAIYDPTTDAWVEIPAPPGGEGRHSAAAAWTGTEAIIWGGHTTGSGTFDDYPRTALAYDPATRSWRELPPAPFGLGSPQAVTVGEGVLFTGGYDERGKARAAPESLWLDPAAGQWRRVPTPLLVVTLVQVDGRVLAAGPVPTDPGAPQQEWHVAEFHPDDRTWSVLTGAYQTDWMVPVVHDGEVRAVSLDGPDEPLRAVRWDGTAWHQSAKTDDGARGVATIEPVGYPPVAVWTGTDLIVGGQQGLTGYDPNADRFTALHDPRLSSFGATAVWTGHELVVPANQNSEGFVFTP